MIIIGVLLFITGSGDEGKASLQDLLQFCTGLDSVPPMGLAHLIKLEYMDQQLLPTASACYCILRLPARINIDEEAFFCNMDTGILGSKNHFGVL